MLDAGGNWALVVLQLPDWQSALTRQAPVAVEVKASGSGTYAVYVFGQWKGKFGEKCYFTTVYFREDKRV